MLGYNNPWALWLRKQCEATPVAIQGLYDLMLSMFVDVPFAKCICIDSAQKGANFKRYLMDNCYFFAPDHLKPLILGLVEADDILAEDDSGNQLHSACIAMVQFAKVGLTDSMQPWFDAQLSTTVAMASSIDYLLSFVTSQDAGR